MAPKRALLPGNRFFRNFFNRSCVHDRNRELLRRLTRIQARLLPGLLAHQSDWFCDNIFDWSCVRRRDWRLLFFCWRFGYSAGSTGISLGHGLGGGRRFQSRFFDNAPQPEQPWRSCFNDSWFFFGNRRGLAGDSTGCRHR